MSWKRDVRENIWFNVEHTRWCVSGADLCSVQRLLAGRLCTCAENRCHPGVYFCYFHLHPHVSRSCVVFFIQNTETWMTALSALAGSSQVGFQSLLLLFLLTLSVQNRDGAMKTTKRWWCTVMTFCHFTPKNLPFNFTCTVAQQCCLYSYFLSLKQATKKPTGTFSQGRLRWLFKVIDNILDATSLILTISFFFWTISFMD